MPLNIDLAEEFFGRKNEARKELAGDINGKPIFALEFSALETFDIDCETAVACAENGSKADLLRPARRIVRSIADEKSNLLFDSEKGTLERIMAMPTHLVEQMSAAVDRANRFKGDDRLANHIRALRDRLFQYEGKDVTREQWDRDTKAMIDGTDIKKKSETTPSTLPSDSPETSAGST